MQLSLGWQGHIKSRRCTFQSLYETKSEYLDAKVKLSCSSSLKLKHFFDETQVNYFSHLQCIFSQEKPLVFWCCILYKKCIMRREKIWPSAALFLEGLSFSNPRGSAKWDCMRRDFVNFETRTTFV